MLPRGPSGREGMVIGSGAAFDFRLRTAGGGDPKVSHLLGRRGATGLTASCAESSGADWSRAALLVYACCVTFASRLDPI